MQPKKNEVHINKITDAKSEIEKVRKNLTSNYNNKEIDIVTLSLRQAEMWCDEYIEKLKDE